MNKQYAVYRDVISSNTFTYVPDEILDERLVHYEPKRLYNPLEHKARITKHVPPIFDDLESCVKWCEEANRQEKEYQTWDDFRREMFDYKIDSKHWNRCKKLWDTKDEPFFRNWYGHVIYRTEDNGEWRDIYTDEIIRKKLDVGQFTCCKCGNTFKHGTGIYGGIRSYKGQLRVYCKNCY